MERVYPCCGNHPQPLITLEVDREKVLEEVARKTAYIAAKAEEKPEEDNFDRVNVDDEDKEELLDYWDEARISLVDTLAGHFVIDGMNEEVPDMPERPMPCGGPHRPQPTPSESEESVEPEPVAEPTEEPAEQAEEPTEDEDEETPDIYKIRLKVWPGFNPSFISIMNRALYSYYVNAIVALWCAMIHHSDSELYGTKAKAKLDELHTRVVRKTFTRKMNPF